MEEELALRNRLALFMICCFIMTLVSPAVYGAESGGAGQSKSADGQASPFADLSGHWANPAAMHMQALKLMNGYEDGHFRPNQAISRAELVTVLDRIFGFAGQGSDSFEDITDGDWYYNAMMRANGSDIIQGSDAKHLSPGAPVTREDAAVLIDRAFQLSQGSEHSSRLHQFSDYEAVSEYAEKALTYLMVENVINGYNGKLSPKAPITRAETAKLLAAMVADVIRSTGVYDAANVKGNLIVRSPGVTLRNVVVQGNLLLAEGIGEGAVTLDGVTVTGSVIVNGGRSIHLQNVKLNEMVIGISGTPGEVQFTDGSEAAKVTVLQEAIVEVSSDSSIDTLTVGSQADGTVLRSEGAIHELIVNANLVMVNDKEVAAGMRMSIQPKESAPDSGTGTSQQPTNPLREKPVPSTTIPDNQWELIWNDEFNGPAIDSSKWSVMDTGLVYNNELQYYSPNNTGIVKENNRSVLQIEAKKGGDGGKDYSSGKLISMGKGDWTYGKVVVRAKLPVQQGMWPAIWMMPTDEAHYGGWPASGEIDIMELIGGEQNKSRVYSTLHFDSKQPDGSHGHDQGSMTLPAGQTFADDYHDFQVEWLPGVIRFYVDGKLHHEVNEWQTKAPGQPEYYTYPAPFDRPFYLILNLAVGGDWPGSPNSDFESETMKVDFVRVYSYKDLANWPDVTGNPPSPVQKREPQQDGNLLYNHDFAGSASADGVPNEWQFIENASGAGSAVVVDDAGKGKAAQVTIDSAGTESYSIQLTQMPMYVEKNKKYKVTFDAKASANRNIMSKVTQFQKNWTNYSGEHIFALTANWQSYEYTFNMRSATDNNARFEFNLGLNDATVSLANVRLIELGDADPLPEVPVERTALPDGNLIYNGTFDQGKDRLAFWSSSIAANADADISVNNFLKFPIMERQLVVQVKDTHGDPNSVALVQPGLKLEANATYGVYFEAKADSPRSFEIDLVSSGGHAVHIPQGKQTQLGTELRAYAGEIVIGDGASAAESELRLLFGGDTGTAYVDNVRLVKRGAPIAVDGYAHAPAAQAWVMQGLQLENSSEGGKHVAYMDEGDLLQFKVEAARDGEYVVSARMASGESRSHVSFRVKDEQGGVVAQSEISLGDTGGWQTYRTIYFPAVSLEAGRSYYIDFEGANYNTLWIDISENKIVNGKLVEDISDWELVPSEAETLRNEDGDLLISLTGASAQWWDELLQQGNLRLEAGKHYRLEFDAFASEDKSLQVVLSQNGGEFTKYLEKAALIGKMKQRYSYTFGMDGLLDPAAVLAFGLGNNTASGGAHTVSIGNVLLFEVNPAGDQGGQPINVNLISNGNFSRGTEEWMAYAAGDSSQLAIQAASGRLQAAIGSAGDNPWDRQVIHEGFAIKQGSRYTLTFKAKADHARKLGIGIGWVDAANNYQWHGYFGQQVELTDKEQLFTFTFDAMDDSYANARISFDMGNLMGDRDGQNTITLSDVSLVNIGSVK